jgi:hypothetical protein
MPLAAPPQTQSSQSRPSRSADALRFGKFVVPALLALAAGAAACRPTLAKMTAPIPEMPSELGRCKVTASQERPLVTEWPASEKANLESQVREGGVVVAYSGCKMRVLPQCVARGQYRWQRTTPATDYIEIRNQDDLYAKLPLGAASLQAELEASGELVVQTTVAGQLRLDSASAGPPELAGACSEATHIVGGLAVGAFALRVGGTSKASAEASVGTASAGGKQSSQGQVIRQAGDANACASSTDAAPDPSCASPIQMFLVPAVASDPGPYAPALTRATTVPIEVRSANPDIRWDVYVDGEKTCSTPCQQAVSPQSVVRLHEKSGLFSRTSKVTVEDLSDWGVAGGVRIEAKTVSAWSLSGLVRMGGLLYSVIGGAFLIPCLSGGEDGPDFCTVSYLTLGIGLPMFGAGTWVMDAPGSARTSPIR